MALTIGRALPNQLALMVERGGILLGRGVWVMSLNCSACVIRGIGLCFHLSIGERESEIESADTVWAQFQRQERESESE